MVCTMTAAPTPGDMDTLSPAERSARMARVRGKDTRPELLVRRLAHRLGYRYRLHRTDLPGQPDMAFSRARKAVFVHGCFWHRHDCPSGRRVPKSRLDFWLPKLEKNRIRDEENLKKLETQGWHPLVIWECEIRDLSTLTERLRTFLDA
jgi:DNA mismatch endonuclease, patch repair protein